MRRPVPPSVSAACMVHPRSIPAFKYPIPSTAQTIAQSPVMHGVHCPLSPLMVLRVPARQSSKDAPAQAPTACRRWMSITLWVHTLTVQAGSRTRARQSLGAKGASGVGASPINSSSITLRARALVELKLQGELNIVGERAVLIVIKRIVEDGEDALGRD